MKMTKKIIAASFISLMLTSLATAEDGSKVTSNNQQNTLNTQTNINNNADTQKVKKHHRAKRGKLVNSVTPFREDRLKDRHERRDHRFRANDSAQS
ncbi:hypothetical protein LO80_08725 [Candidatus Francisella endociliophora]|uniref:Uncharacterized protein n=1 Tax=Candidatus Francisella endociliophora TaxID=653937 RepID=A0A097ER42_9GAMM|nr:hypothetical protein [Francisella sp. FSC1006]AIT10046.1 hypothetical protein LO80_08725 [Francisella sp. FSC1006]